MPDALSGEVLIPPGKNEEANRSKDRSRPIGLKLDVRSRRRSFQEQHILIGRQGPEVVGDQPFELIGGCADGAHGGDDRITRVLGVGQRIALDVLVGRLGQPVRGGLEILDRRPPR
jgi:hypothetical protein